MSPTCKPACNVRNVSNEMQRTSTYNRLHALIIGPIQYRVITIRGIRERATECTKWKTEEGSLNYLFCSTAFLNVRDEYTLADFRVFPLDDHYTQSVLALNVKKIETQWSKWIVVTISRIWLNLPFSLVCCVHLCTDWTCRTVTRRDNKFLISSRLLVNRIYWFINLIIEWRRFIT